MNTDSENNASMARVGRVIPELKSPLVLYPLKRENWLDLNATSINNEDGTSTPAFIPYKKDPGYPAPTVKEDYVWGAGPHSWGYYHLLTKNAYEVLHYRLLKEAKPAGQWCCVLSSNPAVAREDYDVVKVILYNRSKASIPDDFQAQADAVDDARGSAGRGYY